MAIDVVTLATAVGKSKKYTDDVVSGLGTGMTYKGSVATIGDLPQASASNKGWLYTISANGHEYVSDGAQWVDLSADLDSKQDVSNLVTSMSASSDNTHYPSAKSVYDLIQANIYTLPNASASSLGGVKVGSGLSIDANGVLSVSLTNANTQSF